MLGSLAVMNLAILWLLPLSGGFKMALLLLYGAYTAYLLNEHYVHNICRLKRREDGTWCWSNAKGTYEGALDPLSVLTPWVSLLRFNQHLTKKRMFCVIFRDSLPEDHYRRLLVVLRMY